MRNFFTLFFILLFNNRVLALNVAIKSSCDQLYRTMIEENKRLSLLVYKNLELQKTSHSPSIQIKVVSNLLNLNFKIKENNEVMNKIKSGAECKRN